MINTCVGASLQNKTNKIGPHTVAQPDICNGEGTPSGGPLTSQGPPAILIFSSDFGHFILQI